ncbi:putative trimethylamine methyltransferase [Candidatus Promineifilum breve]|uniref:Trimethylamine methyltransferase n=1 Tax=Candidatus Promineifilum breve TaxID=1806508 RepID=A0A160T4I4_9CHLR|nr:trimethylamine methyltransferase family protein [Candidatus Promineifilum breve]CUS05191.2 putative trimethylamine methyltransferase [Candidatus Promineifilum breve]
MRPRIQAVDDALIEQILSEARRILAEIGMEVRGPEMRRRLLEAGLPTAEDGRVLFPADVIDRALASAPRSFTLYNRDGAPQAEIGGDNVHFVPASSGLKILDHRTNETRLATTADFAEYARLADGLPHIAYLATAFSTNDDIEAQVSDAWRLYLCLTNSRKPVVSGAFTEHGVGRMVEMMSLFRHDRADLIARPMSIFTITATGMFRYSEDSCQNMLDCVEAGIPVEIVPVTLMGLIAPVSLVGAAVFHTVDTLAGIIMAQIVRPGAPVLFGGAPAEFHMRAATSPMLGIQALRLDVAYAAVGKALGLPTQAYMALSDSKFLDAQAGAETFGSALLAALAGINSVSGPGMLDYVLTFSLPKLVYDDDLCGQALHFVRHIAPLDDVPTIDLAREVMAEQHLITAAHTMSHWPTELHMPSPVTDRENRENWAKAGGRDLLQRATDEVERRLAAYEAPETDPLVVAEMQRIITAGMSAPAPLPDVPPVGTGLKAAPTNAPRRQRRFTR